LTARARSPPALGPAAGRRGGHSPLRAHRPGESRRGDRRFGAGPHGAPRVGGVVRRGTDPRDVSKAGLAGGGLASRAAEGPKTGTCPRGPPVRRPVVAFFPEGAFGPTNNCVGIADVMRRPG